MKKAILTLALLALMVPFVQAGEDDDSKVNYSRQRADATSFEAVKVMIHLKNKRIVIIGDELDADGNKLERKKFEFVKIDDDPETEDINEKDNQYFKFLKSIQNAILPDGVDPQNGVQKAIKMAVEEKVNE